MSDRIDPRAPVFKMKDISRKASEPKWSVSALEVGVLETDVDPFDPVAGPYVGLPPRPPHAGPNDVEAAPSRNAMWWFDMRHWSPPVTFLVCLGIGVGLLVLSVFRGNAFKQVFFTPPAPLNGTEVIPGVVREVGFVWSPVWSIGCLALIPFAAYVMVGALRWLPDIVEEMGERGMLSTTDYQTGIRGADVMMPWRQFNPIRLIVIVLAAIATFAMLVWPLGPSPAAAVESWRNDVSFYLIARIWAGMILVMFFAFIVYLADFTRILNKPTVCRDGRWEKCRLVPDLSSPDLRRGFELFEGVLQQLLMLGGVVFIACNLARTDAAYLSGGANPSIWDFVYEFVARGTKNPDNAALAGLIAKLSLDLHTIALTLGASLVFLVGYFGLAGAVQEAAVKSARNARHFYRANPNASLSGYPAKEERDALAKMKMRPLLFPTPYLLVSLFTVGLLSILFHQVGLYLFGIALVVMFATVIVRFIRRK